MILDLLSNASNYFILSPRIQAAFHYLQQTNFTNVALGKYEIDGDNLFAIINEYETKERSECVLEAHKKYIDIHYVIRGSEAIGTTLLTHQVPTRAYDEQNDYLLYSDDITLQYLTEGMFILLYPHDLHSPGIHPTEKSWIRKVVMKVLV